MPTEDAGRLLPTFPVRWSGTADRSHAPAGCVKGGHVRAAPNSSAPDLAFADRIKAVPVHILRRKGGLCLCPGAGS